ncbi:MAG: efflux RND transporter periplasmic adaptor subunit [Deltaproteobacteria bacterium]|nr:efflux RND transporter periplasmic adaptor subunit [Deltaproteobacteria bacterium]
MNKQTIIIVGLLVILGGAATYYLLRPTETTKQEQAISHYTCPMHPQIHEEEEGECPICHMKLVPVYKESSSVSPLPLACPEPCRRAEEGGPPEAGRVRGVTISPERQQMIGITTATVMRKPAVKEIRAPGRVAFDADLAVAQTEFLEIAAGSPDLESAARNRLNLLGMGKEEIQELKRRGEPDPALTLPRDGGPVWIYAPLYGTDTTEVKVGQRATMTLPQTGSIYEGVVRGISPVLDPMTRSTRARIEIAGAGGKISPESFLNVTLNLDLGEKLLVPKSAVIETGTRSLVFAVHGSHFSAREVMTGSETADARVILEGLKEGEVVATSAAFLIDSESQLRAAVEGGGGDHHHD